MEEVVSFSVSATTVDRGDTVTLSWDVRGSEEINIYVGYVSQRFPGSSTVSTTPLQPIGATTYTIPDLPITSISFSLLWWDDPASQEITVTVRCPYTFFVEPVMSHSCPLGEVTEYPAAFQPFEHGFMIWYAGSDDLWVFYDEGRMNTPPDTWVEGPPIVFSESPPPGFFQPQRGFGKHWADSNMHEYMGWATAPEQAYTAKLQTTRVDWRGPDYYISLPDERVVFAQPRFGTGTWEFVP